jgi:hypothetical protein
MRHLMLAVLITAVILLGACAKQAPAPEVILTPEEISAYLTELNSNAIQEITQQVADLNETIVEKDSRIGGWGGLGTPGANERAAYEREITAKLNAAEKASTVLNDMLQYADSWEIRDEGNEIYSVSGYGLGYTDQLTTGKWLYYLGPKNMEPKSPDSTRLKDILTAKTG